MVPWVGNARVLLLISSLCCVSLSHGRIIPGALDYSTSLPNARARELQPKGLELNFKFNGVVPEFTPTTKSHVEDNKIQFTTHPSASAAQSFSPSSGQIVERIGDTNPDWQSENYSVSVIQGKKWTRTLQTIAEWMLHAFVIFLGICAVSYLLSCALACCIGSHLLAEVWRTLGGWPAFGYFVHVEQAVYSEINDPDPSRLIAGPDPQP